MKKVVPLLFCLAFILLLYSRVPFQFGTGDNVEELPLIYNTLGIAEYTDDAYIDAYTKGFTPVTPFVVIMSGLQILLPFLELQTIFFIIHLGIVIAYYSIVRTILRAVYPASELSVFLCALGVVGLHFLGRFSPAYRHDIFVPILDPAYIGGVVSGLMGMLFLRRAYAPFFVALGITLLVHPLYTVLLYPAMLGVYALRLYTRQITRYDHITCALTALIIAVYLGFMWTATVPTATSLTGIADIFELNHRGRIFSLPPLFRAWDAVDQFYYGAMLFLGIGAVSLAFSSQKKYRDAHKETLLFALCLFCMILGGSLIGQWHQVPIIELMKPYRMVAHVVVFGWIVACAGVLQMLHRFPIPRLSSSGIARTAVISMTLSLTIALATGMWKENPYKADPNVRDIMQWIAHNTTPSDMFLSYAQKRYIKGKTDLRTLALRPMYFNLNTFPLTGDAQHAWYERFLIQNDLPLNTPPETIDALAWQPDTIHLHRVIRRSAAPIRYILLPKDMRERIVYAGYTAVYESEEYTILQVP